MAQQPLQYPFANDGDRNISLPNATDPDGLVSFQQGWTGVYETLPDLGGEYIERKDMNEILYRISNAINSVGEATGARVLANTSAQLGLIDIGTMYYCTANDNFYILQNATGITTSTTLNTAISGGNVVEVSTHKTNAYLPTTTDLWVGNDGITYANVSNNSQFTSINALQDFILKNRISYNQLSILLNGNNYTAVLENLNLSNVTITISGTVDTSAVGTIWLRPSMCGNITITGGTIIGSAYPSINLFNTANAVINSVTFSAGSGSGTVVIDINSTAQISSNTFLNCANSGGEIYITAGGAAYVRGNTFTNSTSSYNLYVIWGGILKTRSQTATCNLTPTATGIYIQG